MFIFFSLFVLQESLTTGKSHNRSSLRATKGSEAIFLSCSRRLLRRPNFILYPDGFSGLLAKTRFFWNSKRQHIPSQCPSRNKISPTKCRGRNDWGRLQQPRICKTIITLPANYDMVQHIYTNRLASIFQVPGNPFVLLAWGRIPRWMVVYKHHRCS